MSDQRLRSLERTERNSARHLFERMRIGEKCARCGGAGLISLSGGVSYQAAVTCPACAGLSLRKRIEVAAAFCGHEGSRSPLINGRDWIVCPWDKRERFYPDRGSLTDWVRGLLHWGQIVSARAAVAAAEVVLLRWEKKTAFREQTLRDHGLSTLADVQRIVGLPREAIDAALRCVDCPCSEHRRAASLAAISANMVGAEWAGYVAEITTSPTSAGWAGHTQSAFALMDGRRMAPAADMRKAMCDALIAWALGGDSG